MSPEQARGKIVDKRTDVWAFGCVLFEMLTGRKAFDGETLTDTVAAIVKNDPDWQTLPAGTSVAIRSLVSRCLRKDSMQRLRDIADARFQIEDALSQPVNLTANVKPARRAREWVGWIAAGLLLVAALLLAGRLLRSSPPTDAVSFPVFPPDGAAFSAAFNTTLSVPSFALAPDGRALVFSAETPGSRPMLWVRWLDDATARQLAGTEDAQDPLWSPDNRWIAFSAAGKLKKVPVSGGAVQTIAQTAIDFRGGTWGPDETILFAGGTEPILLVNAAGGQPQPVTIVGVPIAGRNPFWLPDGQHFLYTLVAGVDQSGVYVGSVNGMTKKALIPLNTSAVYAPPGYLLYVDGNALLGQALDVDRLELKGQSFLVAEHVGRNSAYMSAVSASRTGSIAYAAPLSQTGHLTWMDRAGHSLGIVATPEADYADFRLSPDETRLAASMVDRNTNTVEIWLTDLARNSTSRFAFGAAVTASALWSPDGSRLAFRANQKGLVELYQRSAAGGGNTQTMLRVETYRPILQTANLVATDWSPDGKQILFSAPSAASGNDLWLLALGEESRVVKFIDSPGEQMHGNFSPDGRLVAYTSNESGRFEVYVETVPRSDRKWAVSTNGGYEPRWRGDGREVYYLSQDRTLMAVAVEAGPSFGIPKAMFQPHVSTTVIANRTHYVPSRDGQRFLVNVATDVAPSPITVVINWTAALKK
jgi:Tol biopolymer transport system component